MNDDTAVFDVDSSSATKSRVIAPGTVLHCLIVVRFHLDGRVEDVESGSQHARRRLQDLVPVFLWVADGEVDVECNLVHRDRPDVEAVDRAHAGQVRQRVLHLLVVHAGRSTFQYDDQNVLQYGQCGEEDECRKYEGADRVGYLVLRLNYDDESCHKDPYALDEIPNDVNESSSDVQIVRDVETRTQRSRPHLARYRTVDRTGRVESGVTVVEDSGAEIAHGNGRRGAGPVELDVPRERGVAGFIGRHDDGARRSADDAVIGSVAVAVGMAVIW